MLKTSEISVWRKYRSCQKIKREKKTLYPLLRPIPVSSRSFMETNKEPPVVHQVVLASKAIYLMFYFIYIKLYLFFWDSGRNIEFSFLFGAQNNRRPSVHAIKVILHGANRILTTRNENIQRSVASR